MVLGMTVIPYCIQTLFASTKNENQGDYFDYSQFKFRTDGQLFNYSEVDQICKLYRDRAKVLVEKAEEVIQLIKYIDLTTLNADDITARVEQVVDAALLPLDSQSQTKVTGTGQGEHCAAVCVYPSRVADVRQRLMQKRQTGRIEIASVAAGFPSGQYKLATRLLEIEMAVLDGATEIDVVINRSAALIADWKTVFEEVAAMKRACASAHMKAILATGELKTLENIYKASWVAMMAGSDFIKTSTGKELVNATLPAGYVMCQAIKDFYELTHKRIGFKPAGGIQTVEQALAFRCLVEDVLGSTWLHPSLFRFGATTLLNNVRIELKKFL